MEREIIDIAVKVWIGYYAFAGGEYLLKVRLSNYVEIANFPLIELGASYFPGAGEAIYGMYEVISNLPQEIAEDTEFPNFIGSGTWQAPTDMFLDRVDNPVIVDPATYTQFSVVPWTSPKFWELTAYYKPDGDTPTEPPESIENYDKHDLGGAGVGFTPQKAVLIFGSKQISKVHFDNEYAFCYSQWNFFYEGVDLGAEHILRDYTEYHPFTVWPYVSNYDEARAIDPILPSPQYGFPYTENNYSWGKTYDLNVYTNDALPAKFYPRGGTPREAPTAPLTVIPLLFLGIFQSGILGIEGIKGILINGYALELNSYAIVVNGFN